MATILGTLCYLKRDGKTLMLYRNRKANDFHEGKWNGLGGKFEPGESPEACAIREVREESGLEVEAPRLHGMLTFPGFDGENDWYVFVFSAERFSGSLIDSPEGELHWIEDARLLDLNLWEGDRIFLPWLDQDRFFSGTFVYANGVLKNHDVVFYSSGHG
ncbi:MAG: 8-oxo-dGTP diphosphatase [Caldilineaceae bacterium SB0662_bin_9]|uniref:8-oxo-dGTP diphosphatase n=1 Tax=Caldilineaceae bacterium SB0662_bin_9 TaxID=2605258 RepID=A0A6B1DSK0_9CHLR|nr:8-oxo-dGTP diphosphatase [Caldilineaceae bacterium]MXZ42354.1 8-oxo-dGTP diphosphatase [Caldilineaceae bacterium SB0666_bin_21]MYD89805.1 8-oxo-dGTP diphosphatase [Caldilineaceae bacterium SB0662_bin_9]